MICLLCSDFGPNNRVNTDVFVHLEGQKRIFSALGPGIKKDGIYSVFCCTPPQTNTAICAV